MAPLPLSTLPSASLTVQVAQGRIGQYWPSWCQLRRRQAECGRNDVTVAAVLVDFGGG
ncbi:MAG: hypothetical protein OXT06_12770 [Rhodospirillaceae bacterium]|nr:hypothetical protein [Rhodospirillaceae bacterium]MDD9915951.1 hypothetical protein [Rhodospirillaceae bacterium]MDD9925199.1 hypothetical protein [Rhodospirillaceae bacterium]